MSLKCLPENGRSRKTLILVCKLWVLGMEGEAGGRPMVLVPSMSVSVEILERRRIWARKFQYLGFTHNLVSLVESVNFSELYLFLLFSKTKIIVPDLPCHRISLRKKLNEK